MHDEAVEQELATIPDHPSLLLNLSGIRFTRSLVFYVLFCRSLFVQGLNTIARLFLLCQTVHVEEIAEFCLLSVFMYFGVT
jgi:hypothetical protein